MSVWDEDVERDPELAPLNCTGREDCATSWHVHGCYEDGGGCTEPHEHVIAASNHYQRPAKP